MRKTVFVGLGAMGYPMAAHLNRQAQAEGETCLVWNRTSSKAHKHAAEHESRVATISEVAQADVIITCLPTSDSVNEMIDRLETQLQPGALWIDCTSGHPDAAHAQRARLAARGVRFLDAPVSGGTSGAEQGTLTVMIGGPADEVEEARAHLPFAAKVVHVGGTGAGFAVKAINNVLLAVNLWAAGEGLAALAGSGVNVSAALDVINSSSGRSNATENLIPQRVVTRQFPVTFTLGLLAKDIGIAMDVVQAARGSAPVLAETSALYRAAAHSLGMDVDHTAALQLVERMNAREIR